MAELEELLDALIDYRDDTGSPSLLGQIFLANLWMCREEGHVKNDWVKRFLADCATTWKAARQAVPADPGDLLDHIANVSRGAGSGSGASRFLRVHLQDAGLRPRTLFKTVCSYETFTTHHVDDDPAKLHPARPPARPRMTAGDLENLRKSIEVLSSNAAWPRPGATLGRATMPDNCWISVDDFGDCSDDCGYGVADSEADRARDELGLIDKDPGEHLVALEFDSIAAMAVPDFEMARPTFADLGNSRFRSRHDCDRSTGMAVEGWGCTVHLKRFADPALHPVAGRAERVTSVLPLEKLGHVHVKYLGQVTQERGKSSADDDAAFLAHLLGAVSMSEIKSGILGI